LQERAAKAGTLIKARGNGNRAATELLKIDADWRSAMANLQIVFKIMVILDPDPG
jgi:hypothetical protein